MEWNSKEPWLGQTWGRKWSWDAFPQTDSVQCNHRPLWCELCLIRSAAVLLLERKCKILGKRQVRQKNGKLQILWIFTERQILRWASVRRDAFHPLEGDTEHSGLGKSCIHPRDHLKMSSDSWRGELGQDLQTVQTAISKDSAALSCSDWFLGGDDKLCYWFNKVVALLTSSLVEHYILKNLI